MPTCFQHYACSFAILYNAVHIFEQCSCPDDIQLHAMQVMFHPTKQNKLLSASVDGLVAVFDLANGLNEDDGFIVSYVLRLHVVA